MHGCFMGYITTSGRISSGMNGMHHNYFAALCLTVKFPMELSYGRFTAPLAFEGYLPCLTRLKLFRCIERQSCKFSSHSVEIRPNLKCCQPNSFSTNCSVDRDMF
jgi:hypothetical protein